MRELWSTVLLVASALSVASSGRIRRDLLDLADMFDLATGLDPSDYIAYGNWCGYGGRGKILDLIDGCCKAHDECYAEAESKCSNERAHFVEYNWIIVNDTIMCGEDTSCASSVCVCDKDVVECIAKHNHTYTEEHRFVKKMS